MLKKDDRKQQMVYYQAGLGTYTNPKIATPMAAKFSKTLDTMIAWNLDSHVMSTLATTLLLAYTHLSRRNQVATSS